MNPLLPFVAFAIAAWAWFVNPPVEILSANISPYAGLSWTTPDGICHIRVDDYFLSPGIEHDLQQSIATHEYGHCLLYPYTHNDSRDHFPWPGTMHNGWVESPTPSADDLRGLVAYYRASGVQYPNHPRHIIRAGLLASD